MTKRTVVRRASLTLFAVLVVVLGAVTAGYAGPTRPGITMQVSPANQSVERGKSAVYTVTVSPSGGFAGSVTLTVGGLPSGVTGAFSANPVTIPSTGASQSSTLTVTTTSSSPVGTTNFIVTGTSGKVSGSVTAGLTVNYPLSSSFSMTASPGSVTMAPGASAVYSLTLSGSGLTTGVTLSTAGSLPAGVTGATFSPNPAAKPSPTSTSSLQVTTSASAADGSYTLYLVGSAKDGSGATRYAYASVQLVLQTSGRPFSISGSLPPSSLAPGKTIPLPLALTNPNNKALDVTNLTVSISQVTRTSTAVAACTTADYAVVQYRGPYPLSVPTGSRPRTLQELGVSDSSLWPQVRMLNTTSNQDGCKGATLTLAYSGSGQGS